MTVRELKHLLDLYDEDLTVRFVDPLFGDPDEEVDCLEFYIGDGVLVGGEPAQPCVLIK